MTPQGSAFALLLTVLLGLGACSGETQGEAPEPVQSDSTSVGSEAAPLPPFKPAASVADLMRSIINYAAEDYWESVSIIINIEGETINKPETDEEWRRLWSDGISLAESGNLLMMPSRAVDEDEWMQFSEDLVDAGIAAAQAASDQDYEAVLEVGEQVYNACLACHQYYVPVMSDL